MTEPAARERYVGAYEHLYHVGGSGGRYRCQWCTAEAFTHGVDFPHEIDCPTRLLRKQDAEINKLRAEGAALVAAQPQVEAWVARLAGGTQ